MVDDKNNSNDQEGKKKDAIILQANTYLKEMVGNILSLDKILHEEVVKDAEYKMELSIETERDNYFVSSTADVARLKLVCSRLRAGKGDVERHINDIREIALSIKNSAGLFGYDLATKFATSLYSLSLRLKNIDENAIIVLESYVESMEVIFSKNITKHDSDLAKELLEEYRIIQKKSDAL